MTMTSPPFAVASAIEPTAAGTFRVLVPDGWQQGRGAFGGLVLGTLLRAVQRSEEDTTRVVRTLSGELCAPLVVGEASVVVRALRRGRTTTFWTAELQQAGQPVARASVVLATPRADEPVTSDGGIVPASAVGATLPRESWTSVRPLEGPSSSVPFPTFAAHYEYRPTGPLPFARASAAPVASGWVRERSARPPESPAEAPASGPDAPVPVSVRGAVLDPLDAPAVVGLVDAWWPASFSVARRPHAIATVAFTLELLVADLGTLAAREPLFHASRVVASGGGFFVELRELWAADGRAVAMNQQTFAVLG